MFPLIGNKKIEKKKINQFQDLCEEYRTLR